ncbi:hypothetical protein M408DRAFT_325884 [Serendipita vermifera MAFF 305830]|uniref:Uncharacterized protein n=1 Tax=Serendipita vermifera MAFF 305830 TaxID=933852 RepID=A0A0C3BCD8_SERVB|nr:hypothetical protein M408DRAFT_325884 [Serendipita vermifera MAFF 305830]
MGRPLFSNSFTNSVGSGDDLRISAASTTVTVAEDSEVRRWNEKDIDPDEEAWWTSKDIIIESFIDQPKASAIVNSNASAHHVEPSTTAQANPDVEATKNNRVDVDRLMLHVTAQIPNQNQQRDVDPAPLFPGRSLTISEEELAGVTLDSIVSTNDNEDDDDFELIWDEDEDEGVVDEELDMDVDEVDVPHSDVSTPAPSTPVTEPSHFMALPVPATSMHDFASHCMLPMPTTPRQGSIQMGPPTGTRPAVRVRGFAVHSPRSELVL